MGARIGSDVPFSVVGGTKLATGRGEILTPLPPLPDCAIVICKPSFAIQTPALFARIDARKSRLRPDTEGICAALGAGDLPGVGRRLYNVFEDVLDRRQAAIGAIRTELVERGALGAVMTGTGSGVFGLFPDRDSAHAAWKALSARYRECWLTHPSPDEHI